MASTRQSSKKVRARLIGFLLLVPLTCAWNLGVTLLHRGPFIIVPPRLSGFTVPLPLTWSAQAVISGEFQKALAARAAELIPLRSVLIRLNNQIMFTVFDKVSVNTVLVGAHGQLIEPRYVEDYCTRTDSATQSYADQMVPLLKDIQAYYRSRGAVFVYVITPSKAVQMPEDFVQLMPCPSTESVRQHSTAEYVQRLREAGIAMADAASPVHEAKTQFPIPLFPQGGIHWNSLGSAIGTRAVIAAINQQMPEDPIPTIRLDYVMSNGLDQEDRDLAELIDVLFPPESYSVPVLNLNTTCATSGMHRTPLSIVGGSFMHKVANLLGRGGCVADVQLYFYLRVGVFGGTPYHLLRGELDPSDLTRLRDAKILVLEENESNIGRSEYPAAFRQVLLGK
jgi:hypothetical protein